MVKISVNRYVSRRVEKIRKEVQVSTQRLREKTLKHLEEIFTMAARVAGDEVKHQRIDGKMVRITLNQQRRWLLVAGQAAKTIKQVATNIDEQEIKAQLNELERLLNETTHRTENIIDKKLNQKINNKNKTLSAPKNKASSLKVT